MTQPAIIGNEVEYWGIDGSIVLYGLMADVLLTVPLIMYLVIADPSFYGTYHQTFINMLYSAYAPLGISWWIVLADDSLHARAALTSAIEMAGLGPFALLWVGMTTYLMEAKEENVLNIQESNLINWIWIIVYPVFNILAIVLHYHVSPPMYAWLEKAPIRQNAMDDPTPWSAPYKKSTDGNTIKNGEQVTTDAVKNINN